MGFPRQECGTGLPFPSPGDLPNPGIEPASLMSPALASEFFTTSATWEAHENVCVYIYIFNTQKIDFASLNLLLNENLAYSSTN